MWTGLPIWIQEKGHFLNSNFYNSVLLWTARPHLIIFLIQCYSRSCNEMVYSVYHYIIWQPLVRIKPVLKPVCYLLLHCEDATTAPATNSGSWGKLVLDRAGLYGFNTPLIRFWSFKPVLLPYKTSFWFVLEPCYSYQVRFCFAIFKTRISLQNKLYIVF